jgi:hypothetical protein
MERIFEEYFEALKVASTKSTCAHHREVRIFEYLEVVLKVAYTTSTAVG